MYETIDRNDLAYWFPKLEAIRAPVPRTEIVRTDVALLVLLDGLKPYGFEEFAARLRAAADRLGYPCFLRTGHTSAKHAWRRTCFVGGPDEIVQHVGSLLEYGELANFAGLPTDTWAVREFLALVHRFTAFEGLPVAVERRWFCRDGTPCCHHPYWPAEAIWMASDSRYREILEEMEREFITPEAIARMRAWVERLGDAFDGDWSVDFALTTDGRWVILDMAEMDRSWHWPGCPMDPRSGLDAESQ